MKNLTRAFVVALVLVLWGSVSVWAGQNASAGIRIDLNPAAGNQNQNSVPPPGTGTWISVDIYATGVSNLDTYEFNLYYPASDLTFQQISKDKSPPNFERNLLNRDNATWTVLPIADTDTPGEISFSGSLADNHGEDSPDGEGLLASIWFECKVDAPGNLTFGTVKWIDYNGIQDLCTDKGEASLPVELFLFEAKVGDGKITLRWTTQSEADNLGFNVYRAMQKDGPYTRLTDALIPGASGGYSEDGRTYAYQDPDVLPSHTYFYKLEDVSIQGERALHGPVSVKVVQDMAVRQAVPTRYALFQSYPNPFNPVTRILYDLPEANHVTLVIYAANGQKVATLVSENQEPGHYSVTWDGNKFGTGVYLYRFQTGSFVSVRKMVLVR